MGVCFNPDSAPSFLIEIQSLYLCQGYFTPFSQQLYLLFPLLMSFIFLILTQIYYPVSGSMNMWINE